MSVTSQSKSKQRHRSASTKAASWWQKGVIYQIYVRSFYDANGDGVGDLPGVIAKLDYLQTLGVDAIWLSPVTVSANADWGYDVVDYRNIDPALGTMADFERLIAAAHKRSIKVVTDFVPNHTSVKHPWFQDALTGKASQYRGYYIWADPKDGKRPNNWRSWFGGSAWQLDKASEQYYLHNFLPEQADLNWRNPELRAEFDDILRFWLDKGVDGFRVDVFNMLIKDDQLRDNPKPGTQHDAELHLLGQVPTYNVSQPGVHDVLKRWRKIIDHYPGDRLLLGETTMAYSAKQVAVYYGREDEMKLAFNFNFLRAPLTAEPLKRVVAETERAMPAPHWPVWAGSNHDEPSRLASRWAHGDTRKVRCALLMLLALRGTPVLYYGDELGLENVYVAPWRLKDPWGAKYWPAFAGRDRGRTPMPWQLSAGAGFTEREVRPWLPYGKLEGHNVAEQLADPNSILNLCQAIIALRRQESDFQVGEYKQLKTTPSLWAWQRGEGFTVVINMSNHHQEMTQLDGTIKLATNQQRNGESVDGLLHLAPWEGVIVER